MKAELARTSRTLALSLDIWTSENQIAIMGIIGHWITPEFEKRDELSNSPRSMDRILERI